LAYKSILWHNHNRLQLIIPAAGNAWDGSLNNSGDNGNVWSSMLSTGNVSDGQYLVFGSVDADLNGGGYRSGGFSVRGVLG
jgi:hypothetical protein